MKEIIFENIFNKEKFRCVDHKDIQIIDGIEFLKVFPQHSNRTVWMRKDSLKKVIVKK